MSLRPPGFQPLAGPVEGFFGFNLTMAFLNYFRISFDDELDELLEKASSIEDRLVARTIVGHKYLAPKVRSAGLQFLECHQSLSIERSAEMIVIGVASYSDPDIDVLNEFMTCLRLQCTFIFDIDCVRSHEDLTRFMPMAPLFIKNPVLATYKNGILSSFEQGAKTVQWLRKCCN